MKKIAVISHASDNWHSFETSTENDILFEEIKKMFSNIAEDEDGAYIITAMNLGVETLAAEAAIKLKDTKKICLECIIPYEEQAKDWLETERDRYYSIIEGCDKEKLLSSAFTQDCLQKCYEYMIDSADIILVGNAPDVETADYIVKSEKPTIYINKDEAF